MHLVFSASEVAESHVKILIWLVMNFLQVLQVALINCTQVCFSETPHDDSLNALISSVL